MTLTTLDAATTVRRLLEAFLAGDLETFTSYTDDDIEWNPAQLEILGNREPRSPRADDAILTAVGVIRREIQHELGALGA